MITKSWWRATGTLLLAVSGALLQACGGGGDSEPPPVNAGPIGQVQGEVLSAANGQPVAGATVSVRSASTQTDAQGRFTLTLQESDTAPVRAAKAGFADALAQAAAAGGGKPTPLRLWLSPVAATQTVSTAAAVVSVPNSSARVSLPDNAFADAGNGQAFTGNAEVRLTPIDPGAQPGAMPGSFQARTAGGGSTAIESFGALAIDVRDPATGRALNLAAGKTATIRIPLASRSANPPATLPLYHLDDTTGQWVEEGSATLVGSGPNAYYEGTVSHFSYWNADRPTETIYVDGCVRTASGAVPDSAMVRSEGLDYSGSAFVIANADGTFRVAIRKGGHASVVAETPSTASDPVLVGPSQTDIHLSDCLVLKDVTAQPPSIVSQPESLTLDAYVPAFFRVVAVGSGLHYQWQRDGADIPGATAPVLWWVPMAGDSGAKFRVIVSNAGGSVTSTEATLTRNPGTGSSPEQQARLMRLMYAGFASWEAAMAPTELLHETLPQLVAPSSVCSTGSMTQALYDGVAVNGGEPLTPGVQHTLDVRFSQCVTADSSTYDGRGVAQFSFTESNGSVQLTATSAVTDMASAGDQVVVNGSFAYQGTSNEAQGTGQGQLTPSAGATVRSQTTGQTLSFESGRMEVSSTPTSSTTGAVDLAFTLEGSRYVVSGQITYNVAGGGSGEMRLTKDGVLLGRDAFVNGQRVVEVFGEVQPFSVGGRGPRPLSVR